FQAELSSAPPQRPQRSDLNLMRELLCFHPGLRMKQHSKLSDLLSALAEPVRLRLMLVLEQEELSVGELTDVVQLPQSTTSRHLKVLGDAGLLLRRAVGPAMLYKLVLDDLAP